MTARRALAFAFLLVATSATQFGEGDVVAGLADADPTWNSGIPTALSFGLRVEPRAQVLTPNGSMFVVSDAVDDHLGGPIITRVGADGAVDSKFGQGGSVRLAPPNLPVGDLDAIFQPADGRLVVVGQRAGMQDWALMAMSSDGSLDTSFGTAGSLNVGLIDGYRASGVDPQLLLTADGGVIAVGFFQINSFHTLGAIKFSRSGQLDESFGTGGLALMALPAQPSNYIGQVGGAALDSTGRIVVVGVSPSYQFVVARWTAQGAVDTSFSDDGFILGDNAACGIDVAVDAADRVVVACTGSPTLSLTTQVAVVRYRVDGGLDTTFGSDGVAAVPPQSSHGGAVASAVATFGNSIVLGGNLTDVPYNYNVAADAVTWRFLEGGQLDRGFGEAGGVVRSDFARLDRVTSVVMLPDGRLSVLVGSATEAIDPQVAVYRFRPTVRTANPSMRALDRPERLLDTRLGVGAAIGKVGPAVDLELGVVGAGDADVPSDAVAVALNVTATQMQSAGFLTVYPCGVDLPLASNLNFAAGDTIPNLVIVKVGEGGRVCIHSSTPSHVIADLVAFYGADTDLHPLDVPTRKIDTRTGLGVQTAGQKIGGGVLAALPALLDRPYISEYVLNVTVAEADAPGFVTVYQCGSTRPVASNLNITPGQTIANLVVARVRDSGLSFPTGAVCFYASTPTHLIVDVIASLDAGAAHRPLAAPVRLLDTREGIGAPLRMYRAGEVLELDVTGVAGVPDDATAVALNVTVTQPQAAGFLTVYPCGQTPPLASNLNFRRGQTIPNLVFSKIGVGGRICITGIADAHILADLAEWYPTVV
jgi:uncharacterized delta-60 repeat protein